MKNFRKLGILVGLLMILSTFLVACSSNNVKQYKDTSCIICKRHANCYSISYHNPNNNKDKYTDWVCSKLCEDQAIRTINYLGYKVD